VTKGRLEAFSDGVIAILITIMVLELKVPEHESADLHGLAPLWPVFLAYVLSFVYLGIYWNNHHHMFHACATINGRVMWANLHLLFWLSLVPFGTHWVGRNHNAPLPTAVYGVILLLCGVAYLILAKSLVALHGPDSSLAIAFGKDWKGKISIVLYAVAVPAAFVHQLISDAIYVAVAVIWFVPDRRIESSHGTGRNATE
jgi:uncharacterized membrane protein